MSTGERARPRWDVEVRRSARRRRTVQAYLRDRTVVVLVPARITKAEEKFWVAEMVGRLERQEDLRLRRRDRGDDELLARARELSRRYLGGRARPTEVRWVQNQNDRWGSCTPARGTIRLSHRLRAMPAWVSDYVLVHELAHLLEDGHGPAFWRLVASYPRAERARGYLEGVAAAAGLDLVGAEPEVPADPVQDELW
ncbi:MAG: M48 family metallopeptidase [Streptosporangiales bacterium]|nr:M48 family metallopeptidase [Streptosporangiales bacterium]